MASNWILYILVNLANNQQKEARQQESQAFWHDFIMDGKCSLVVWISPPTIFRISFLWTIVELLPHGLFKPNNTKHVAVAMGNFFRYNVLFSSGRRKSKSIGKVNHAKESST